MGSLWLLRHGEPSAKTRGLCYGALDVELSRSGVRQAELAAATLSEQPAPVVDVVNLSPRSLAGRQGLEPRYADPESAVLPLDDLPDSHPF